MSSTYATAMLNTNSPAFYVGSDSTRSGKAAITIHAAKSVVSRQQMNTLRLELAERGHTGAIKLRRHSDSSLERARSIGLSNRFASAGAQRSGRLSRKSSSACRTGATSGCDRQAAMASRTAACASRCGRSHRRSS